MSDTPHKKQSEAKQLHEQDLLNAQAAILNVLEDSKKDAETVLGKKALDEAILASIGDGLVVADNMGRITYVNQAFEKMVGWTYAEVLGRHFLEVVPREDERGNVIPFTEHILNKVLAGEVVVADLTNPYYYIRKDKSRFPTSSIVNSIVLGGEIIGVVETFRDITREKGIDKAKTEFVSLASHQLRTPLSTINWYTEMLLAGDVGPLNPDQERYLHEVYTGNQRMVVLVNALLSVSRMELGTFVYEPEPTDMALLVQTAIHDQKVHIDRKHIVLTTTFDPAVPLIQADSNLLSIVVQNILSNAVTYTPPKGTIHVSLTARPHSLLLSVADSGYGIPQNQQGRIFTKLFRADNVRERDTEGTGLGLYIAKSIIDNSGGTIWFTSTENVGTTFFVELPSAKVSAPIKI